ncbi:hypothetical protein BH23VER1_BH23VER1_25750 [soil metagenome]
MKNFPLLIAVGVSAAALIPDAGAASILGTGAGALLGGDLTDPEDDGTADGMNYNAVFAASEEPGFGGGEFAFNVFNNLVGGGNAKWCCGDQNDFPNNPIWVQATFDNPIVLTHFTLTSGNDTAGRDPVDWAIQGSNDGVNFDSIFTQTGPGTEWTARDQVVRWDGEGADFATPDPYSTIRLHVTATSLTTGARFQLNEFEIFGTVIPEPSQLALLGMAGAALFLRRRR